MPQPRESADFFRQPLAEMIDLRHPLAVLSSRLPWAQIEATLAPRFARQVREGRAVAQDDLFGPSLQVAGAGVAAAGRPRLAIRLMASLLYLKHAYKLSDEELVERWAENVVWQHFSAMTFYEPRLPCDATQKLYALHAPEVQCIGKRKARKPYEFGVKVSVAITHKQGLMVGARSFTGNPYDGHTLAEQLEQGPILTEDTGAKPKAVRWTWASQAWTRTTRAYRSSTEASSKA